MRRILSPSLFLLLAACGGKGKGSTYTKAAGDRDAVFSTGQGFTGTIYRLLMQDDGKVLVAGNIPTFQGSTIPYLARLDATGALDGEFKTLMGAGPADGTYAVARASSGQIYVGGSFVSVDGRSYLHIARLESTGSLDSTYLSTLGNRGFDNKVNNLAIDGAGRVLACGEFMNFDGTAIRGLARLSETGELDTGFKTSLGTGFNLGVNVVLPESDGHLLVGGSFTSFKSAAHNRLVRLNNDGTEDVAFSLVIGNAFDAGVSAIALDTDGGYLIGGDFIWFNGTAVPRLVKLSPSGVLDTNFIAQLGTGPQGAVKSIVVDLDGNIVLGGEFPKFNGLTAGGIARISNTGTLDTAFLQRTGSGFDGFVYALALLPTGPLLAGGDFTTYQGLVAGRVARIK